MEENNSKKTNKSTDVSIILSIITIVVSLILIFAYNKLAIGLCFIGVGIAGLGANIEKKKNENKEK